MLTLIIATMGILYAGYKVITTLPAREEEVEISKSEYEWYFGKGVK